MPEINDPNVVNGETTMIFSMRSGVGENEGSVDMKLLKRMPLFTAEDFARIENLVNQTVQHVVVDRERNRDDILLSLRISEAGVQRYELERLLPDDDENAFDVLYVLLPTLENMGWSMDAPVIHH